MALYDSPPQVDPATGRLPSYKQVLQQDPTTGTYKIKYEYTPIASSSTQGQTLQTMLTTPITTLSGSTNMGVGSQDGDAEGGDTGDTGVGGATSAATGGGGRDQGGVYDFQRAQRDGGGTPFASDDRSELQKQLDTAYPTVLERGLGIAGGIFLSGVNPVVGKLGTAFMTNQRKNAIEDINQAMEDGTFLSGYKTSEIAKALEDNSNLPDNVADYMRNAISMASTPVKKPTQTQVSTQVAPTTFQGITQDYLDSLPDTPMKGPNIGSLGITPTKKPTIQERMEQAKLKAAAQGKSRDEGEKASTEAFNQATSNFQYSGDSITSFKGTSQESTQIGTFSERRKKEEEGRKEDGTAEEGSIADLRDIAGEQNQPEAREVDRDNPVSNKAGKNEVSDKHGNAVTNNGKAINTGKQYNPKLQEKAASGSGPASDRDSGRIICTELYRQRLLSKEDYMLDLYYTSKYLTPQHTAGYWYFAVPAVKSMRRSKFWTAFWKEIAYNRLQDIKWRLGEGKFNLRGRIYSAVFEPFCYISGYFTSNSDYNELYEGEN